MPCCTAAPPAAARRPAAPRGQHGGRGVDDPAPVRAEDPARDAEHRVLEALDPQLVAEVTGTSGARAEGAVVAVRLRGEGGVERVEVALVEQGALARGG